MNENREEVEIAQDVVEEIIEPVDNVVEEEIKNVKKSKLEEAQELIESSKKIVSQVDSEVDECKIGVSEVANEFDATKATFNETVFSNCKNLLEKVGYEYSSSDDEPFELSLGNEEEQEKFYIENIKTGRFTGLILALIMGLLTAIGLVYFALTQLKVDIKTLTPETATEQINPILTWIGTFGGHTGGNMVIGAIILGFSSLIVAWIVYAIRVNLKAKKNLYVAQKVYEKSSEYCMSKEECKGEMKKIDSHLREATVEISNFKMMLEEQIAKLKRVLHVEGEYDEEREYHPTSKKIMRETEKEMRAIEKLLNTAITKNGRLNFQSVQALSSAREVYADYLGRIYD